MPERYTPPEPEWSAEVLVLAAEEASASGYTKILPAHLLIALCRFVDVNGKDFSDAKQATQRRVRRELEALSIDPQRFRRRVRSLIVKGPTDDAAEVLQREFQRYISEHGRSPGLASATGCGQSTLMVMKHAAALAGANGDPDGLQLLRTLVLGDMELNPQPIRPLENLPERL